MNKRLVWNFEIGSKDSNQLPSPPSLGKEALRWEKRFFWPENSIITLHGLSDDYLHLANADIKYREDTYYVLPSHDYNIKKRREELLYKPLLEISDSMHGYGKKIHLSEQNSEHLLPGIPPILTPQLIKLVNTSAHLIHVQKDAVIYKLHIEPTIKLELSRLTIHNRRYFSACIEGKSASLVQLLSQRILKGHPPIDYVRFLKERLS